MTIVQSVERALTVLDALSMEKEGMSIKELSDKLNLPKSTIHRLLLTLKHRRFVRQDRKTGYYLLGTEIISLATHVLDTFDLRTVARPELEQLSSRANEVVHLCVRDENQVVYIDKVESDQTITMRSKIGRRSMLHCTAVGKVILAWLDKRELQAIIAETGLPRYTEQTITSFEQLEEELKTIRTKQFAIDNIEHEEGIRCIAAPVFDYHSEVVGTISVAGPEARMTLERIEGELKAMLLTSASVISRQLGYER